MASHSLIFISLNLNQHRVIIIKLTTIISRIGADPDLLWMGDTRSKNIQENKTLSLTANPHFSTKYNSRLSYFPDSHIIIEIPLKSVEHYKIIEQAVQQRKFLNTHQDPYFITSSFSTLFEGSKTSLSCSLNEHPLHAGIGYRFVENETLRELGKSLYKRNMYFTNEQAIAIFSQLLSILDWLFRNETRHGDLRLETIFIVRVNITRIELAVLDSFFMNEGLTNYQMYIKEPDQKYLLSPYQLKNLKKNFLGYRHLQEDDCFAVGMLMLELLTFKSSSECYDFRHAAIKQNLIDLRLQEASAKYDRSLIEAISRLLRYEHIRQINYPHYKLMSSSNCFIRNQSTLN